MSFGSDNFRGAFTGPYAGTFGGGATSPPPEPPERDFLVGDAGSLVGVRNTLVGAFGDLNPDWWESSGSGEVVVNMFTDGFDLIELNNDANTGTQWGTATQMEIELVSLGTTILTWDGSFNYQVTDAVFAAILRANIGNTLTAIISPV